MAYNGSFGTPLNLSSVKFPRVSSFLSGMQGKTFIVTGGASGLGEACVRRLVSRGANVGLFDLNTDRANDIAKELGDQVIVPGPVDVTSESAVQEALRKVTDRFRNIHGVINCGGVAGAARIARKGTDKGTMSLDFFQWIVSVNLVGTFNVCRQVARLMADRNEPDENGEHGVIINTASIAYQDGQTGQTAYSASKGGVASMTLPMARDLAPLGIRVVTIAPGAFETNMTSAVPEHLKENLLKDALFPRRMGRPDEFAKLVEEIIGNGMLNGEIIRLDGGSRLGKL